MVSFSGSVLNEPGIDSFWVGFKLKTNSRRFAMPSLSESALGPETSGLNKSEPFQKDSVHVSSGVAGSLIVRLKVQEGGVFQRVCF